MYSVYILFSQNADRYYIGHTGDSLKESLRKHNGNHAGFTGRFSDWMIVYSEDYPDNASAYRRERELKGWKDRHRLTRLIRSV